MGVNDEIARHMARKCIFMIRTGGGVVGSDTGACNLGPVSIWRLSFPGMVTPMLNIRRSRDCLIFNMRITVLVRRHIYVETPPPPPPPPPPGQQPNDPCGSNPSVFPLTHYIITYNIYNPHPISLVRKFVNINRSANVCGIFVCLQWSSKSPIYKHNKYQRRKGKILVQSVVCNNSYEKLIWCHSRCQFPHQTFSVRYFSVTVTAI